MKRPVDPCRPLGRVHPSGVITCGLCDVRGALQDAESKGWELRPWRMSRAHGAVHAGCLRALRTRARRFGAYVATLDARRDRRGRFQAPRIKMQESGGELDIIALMEPRFRAPRRTQVVVTVDVAVPPPGGTAEMHKDARHSGRVNTPEGVHKNARRRPSGAFRAGWLGELLDDVVQDVRPAPRGLHYVRHVDRGAGRILDWGRTSVLVRYGDHPAGAAGAPWTEVWTPLREVAPCK